MAGRIGSPRDGLAARTQVLISALACRRSGNGAESCSDSSFSMVAVLARSMQKRQREAALSSALLFAAQRAQSPHRKASSKPQPAILRVFVERFTNPCA